MSVAGFCGKLPVRADFVTRRLSPTSVEAWHGWLAEALAAARAAMGDAWLDAYLHGPIWRFALPPGLIGPAAMAGTLTPSVDSVGRYFPWSIMLPLPSVTALAGAAAGHEDWFAAAEALSLAALEEDLGLEDIDAGVASLPAWAAEPPGTPPRPGHVMPDAPGLVFPLDPEGDWTESPAAVFGSAHLGRGGSLWWTLGGERVGAAAVLAAALPPPVAFPAFLSGDWAKHGWHEKCAGGAARAALASEQSEAPR